MFDALNCRNLRHIATDKWQTVLFNDETHTYDAVNKKNELRSEFYVSSFQVIHALVMSIDCDETQAMRLASTVDREGRTVVCFGARDKCNYVKENVQVGDLIYQPFQHLISRLASNGAQHDAPNTAKRAARGSRYAIGARRVPNAFGTPPRLADGSSSPLSAARLHFRQRRASRMRLVLSRRSSRLADVRRSNSNCRLRHRLDCARVRPFVADASPCARRSQIVEGGALQLSSAAHVDDSYAFRA